MVEALGFHSIYYASIHSIDKDKVIIHKAVPAFWLAPVYQKENQLQTSDIIHFRVKYFIGYKVAFLSIRYWDAV